MENLDYLFINLAKGRRDINEDASPVHDLSPEKFSEPSGRFSNFQYDLPERSFDERRTLNMRHQRRRRHACKIQFRLKFKRIDRSISNASREFATIGNKRDFFASRTWNAIQALTWWLHVLLPAKYYDEISGA